jgi:hypothetical protein
LNNRLNKEDQRSKWDVGKGPGGGEIENKEPICVFE